MPITKGDRSVVLHRDILPRLEEAFQAAARDKTSRRAQGQSFQGFVNNVLKDYLDKKDFLREKFPQLSKVAIEDNVVFVKDSKRHFIAEVFLRDSKLYCDNDESETCEHVQFVLSLPETGRLKINQKRLDDPDTA